MNKKCKGCQWYNKPYWSIINPCDSCPNENDNLTIVQIDGIPIFKEAWTEEEIKRVMTNKSIFELTIEEKDQEIERLNKSLEEQRHFYLEKLQQKENIIKEVREKLLCYGETFDSKIHQQMQKELLEILDKE